MTTPEEYTDKLLAADKFTLLPEFFDFMNLYPIMLNLEGRPVVIIGGGSVALRKVRDLLEAGACIKVIAPDLHADLDLLAGKCGGRLTLKQHAYEPGDLAGALLVFCATNDSRTNRAVAKEARQRNILINAADDPSNCSFYLPSFMRKGDLLLSLSTGGASPAMAARLRRELEKHIPENIEEILRALAKSRQILKSANLFKDLDAAARAGLLKKITRSDHDLEKIRAAFSDGKLEEFLLKFTTDI